MASAAPLIALLFYTFSKVVSYYPIEWPATVLQLKLEIFTFQVCCLGHQNRGILAQPCVLDVQSALRVRLLVQAYPGLQVPNEASVAVCMALRHPVGI